MVKKEVIKKLKQYKSLLSKHFQMESLYLFGSYANNTHKENGDIDVAVVVSSITGNYFSSHHFFVN